MVVYGQMLIYDENPEPYIVLFDSLLVFRLAHVWACNILSSVHETFPVE